MSFWDNVKDGITKGVKYAEKGVEMADNAAKSQARRFSDSELKENLKKYPNNKYLLDEANKRGL